MKKFLSVLFILAVLVSFSGQDKALANDSKDARPEIMKSFSVVLEK